MTHPLHSSQSLSLYNSARNLPRRYKAEKRFRFYSKAAVILVLIFLATLLSGIVVRGLPAFQKNQMRLDIFFDPQFISVDGKCHAQPLLQKSILRFFPAPHQKINLPELFAVISPGVCETLLKYVRSKPESLNRTLRIWLPVSDDADLFLKNKIRAERQNFRRLQLPQVDFLTKMEEKGRLRTLFNMSFFKQGDARNPEYAGIASAALGSFYLILISLLFACPLGIATALYLEEFKRKDRLTTWIEVSISNLAAVPSIVFGILGLALFLGFLDLPRSSALVGGLTLGMMILPVIILTARSALKGVPKTLRYAAQALGASDVQVAFHHVLPLAMPGILTGIILAIARVCGETAPLLMIGMMAFVKDKPYSPLDPASALPTQIFAWSRNPEPGFLANAAAGIIILITFLIFLNLIAIFLRRKFEHQRS